MSATQKVTRDALNSWRLNARSALAAPYFLVVMTSQATCLSVTFIATSSSGTGQRATLSFTEVGDGGTVDAAAGEVILSPPGDWDVTVYDQTSSSNLDTDNANAIIDQFVARVEGSVCASSGWSGVGGGSCDPVTIEDQDGNTVATVASGGAYTVTLADEILDPLTATTDVIVDPL